MKNKLFAILLSALLSFSASAQKTIAVLTGNNWTFYADFSTALNQCAAGSTIYLPGGVFTLSQGFDTIAKSVSIIGVGHYPDSTTATNRSVIAGGIYLVTGGDNVLFSGLELTGSLGVDPNSAGANVISNLTINRCNISNYNALRMYRNDSVFIHNVYINESVGDFLGSISKDLNILITNSIIRNSFSICHYGTTFKNNVILGNVGCSGCSYTSISYCNFENNVIGSFSNGTINQCVFKNNLIVGSSTTCSGCVVFSNNLFSTLANTFVNVPAATFTYNYDYHLLSSSIGKNAGTDGTDIGIYGTSYPYKSSAVPANPHISTKLIAPSSAPNGTLPINIRVIAQDR